MNDDLPERMHPLDLGARFDRRSNHAAVQRHSLAVLLIKLDGFVPMNAGHGGAAGEAVQRIVAAALAQTAGTEKLLSALASGEFACLLSGLPTREQLSLLAWRLLDALGAPMRVGVISLALRPSIGIARWPADGTGYQALLRNAGAAMYRARNQKSGFAFFDAFADVWEHDA